MKSLFVILIVLLALPAARAEQIKFFTTWSFQSENKNNDGKLDLFCIHLNGEISKQLDEYFPCATHTDFANISALINHEREKQLLGVGDDAVLESIAGSIGAQYLISIKIIETGSKMGVFVKCIDMKKAKAIVNEMTQAPVNEDAFEEINNLADKFINQLLKYEICPYKGRIKVEVISDLKVDEKKEYPIYCNEQDRLYKMHYKTDKHSENFWTFEKQTKVYARTFVDYTISEETEKEIEDGCYQCPQGKTRRYFRETNSKNGKINEASSESQLYGVQVNDTRIEITFNDDGTYIMKIEATSNTADITETNYKYAESWCDNDNKPPQTIKNKTDIPFTYIFGPYKGTARDESLTLSEDKTESINSISGEKVTYIISFDLAKE